VGVLTKIKGDMLALKEIMHIYIISFQHR